MMHRTFTAAAPLDQIARAIMDAGFTLCPRDDTHHEYARLGKPNKHDPSQVVIVYRCGCIRADGPSWQPAARILATLAKGGAQ